MEEEKIVDAEVVEEPKEATEAEATATKEDTTSKPAMDVEGNKYTLIAFILAVIGVSFCFAWTAGFVGVGCGIAALIVNGKANPDRKPFTVFEKFVKPCGLVAIIVGAVMFITAIVVTVIGAIAAAANGSAIALF